MPQITFVSRSDSRGILKFLGRDDDNAPSVRRQTQPTRTAGSELVFGELFHDKGLSGFTGENRSKGALSVFLKAVETGLMPVGSFLLVETVSAETRSSEQMGIGLINASLTLVTLADGQSFSKTTIDSDLSKLMLSLVVMMRAHEESLTKSRRLKAAWEDKRRRINEVSIVKPQSSA